MESTGTPVPSVPDSGPPKPSMGVVNALVREFISKVNKDYKSNVASLGKGSTKLNLKRFSSGIHHLDLALGGGWPFGRINIIAGDESTGKTAIALKAMESIKNYDRTSRMHCERSEMKGKVFTPCVACFVDAEGTFDAAWATKLGVDLAYHVVVRNQYAEQAIDIVDMVIRDNTFDLIIVDSLAALTPSKEIESSVEEWQMGLAARLLNKAMRKWQSSLNKAEGAGPCLLCLNQFRINLGVMYGDNRDMPGGKGQKFAASVIVNTKSPKVINDDGKTISARVELSGITKKNKTFNPKIDFEWELELAGNDYTPPGSANNPDVLLKFGKKYDLIKKVGGSYSFETVSGATEEAFKIALSKNSSVMRKLWWSIESIVCGAYF